MQHVVSEAKNDLYRRYSIEWESLLAILAEPEFFPGARTSGPKLRESIYAAAEELLRRQALA